MTYGTHDTHHTGRMGFNEQTGNPEKDNPYMTERSLKEYEDTSRLEATAREHLEKVYRWVLHHGVHRVPGDAEISPRRITGSALISALVLGLGVGGAAAHTGNTTDADYGDNITITIRGNVSDESPLPEDYLVTDDGNLSKIGPALTLAAMVAKYESEKLRRVEKEVAEIINLDGEHKYPPMDVSKFVNADWSEVIEWRGNLYWPDGSMGRAKEGHVYKQVIARLNDAEESYYRNIYDGPKKPKNNRIFDDEIAIK